MILADYQNTEPLYTNEWIWGASSNQLYSQDSGTTVGHEGTVSVVVDGHKVAVCRQLSVQSVTSQPWDNWSTCRVGPRLLEEAV